MPGEEFEWDQAKAIGNLAKHRVSFEAARGVFRDVFALERHDLASREVRYIITGMANGVILTVIYTKRGERIRIISARKATRNEQNEYYRNQTPD
jgi:uncharacterized DUF497 family protein